MTAALRMVTVGGGVAALEATLALRELAGARVRVPLSSRTSGAARCVAFLIPPRMVALATARRTDDAAWEWR